MTQTQPLRLWPGVVAVVLMWVLMFGTRLVLPAFSGEAMLAGMACVLLVLAWWLFFSRAPWSERIGAIVLMAVAVWLTRFVVHPSIAGGMMGMMPVVLSLPLLSLALVAWAAASRNFPRTVRRATLVPAIVLACVPLLLIRTDGLRSAGSDLAWRWTPTAEQRLLAQTRDEVLTSPAVERVPAATNDPAPTVDAAPKSAEAPVPASGAPASTAAPAPAAPRAAWPGFRGPARDGVIPGIRIETDWSSKPPVALWRRPIGPGWSSFAVQGDLIYTQEQRGEHEIVSAYKLSTGEPVWRHQDAVRFYESNGGAGPRATPALHDGRIYAHGATGIVNALDGATGAVLWSRNASADTKSTMPGWGFASSPLVLSDAVIVASSGRLVAYDAATGKPRWVRTTVGGGYSSPHLTTIDGVEQILLLSGGGGATSVNPADGAVLWQHTWDDGVAIVQPAVIANRDVILAGGDMMGGVGMRRLAVTKSADGWSVAERWTSRGLKPYFNDFVIHKGHAFGFDGTILSCINLENGERKWKGGRYGAGQMVLVPDQDLLLVLSEDGELALVSATPDKHTEIAKMPALEGKTWNHPVIVGDVLLVRNGEEMAAFRLPVVTSVTAR
ncbi:MAG: PQQ-binding-like beta-propeller repeat protein [Vicinamibacterales bacterium]